MSMGARVAIIVFFAMAFSAFAGCPSQWQGKKDLKQVYRDLRKTSKVCRASVYNEYAARALLAGRFAESLWATKQGLQSKKIAANLEQELKIVQGSVFTQMGRYEEAISTLKEVAFDGKGNPHLVQKAHLMLIRAYYDKAGQKRDSNVIYLVNLFRNRYPSSDLLAALEKWVSA